MSGTKRFLDLKKGIAKISISLEQKAEVPRDVDALVLTNDANWKPQERGFPPQAYSNYLLKWSQKREPLKPLIETNTDVRAVPRAWLLARNGGS